MSGDLKSNLNQLLSENKVSIKKENINVLRQNYQNALGKYMIAYRNYKTAEESGSNINIKSNYQRMYKIEETNMNNIKEEFVKANKKTKILKENLRKIIKKNENELKIKKSLQSIDNKKRKDLDYQLMNNKKQISNLRMNKNKKDLDPVFGFGFFTIRKKLYSNILIILNIIFYLLILYYIYKILILA